MAEAGYKQLISYKLALIAFELGWDFVPRWKSESGRGGIRRRAGAMKNFFGNGLNTDNLSLTSGND